jgi:dipeptidyl aminopeptidase/acylaminoacyl peptidase
VAARAISGDIDEEPPEEDASLLRITRWDGKDNRRIATAILDVCPSFSPDGIMLAYASANGVKVYERRTQKHRLLMTGVQPIERNDRSLQWSPDGEWLAFVGIVSAEEGRSSKSDASERPHFVCVVHRSGNPFRRLMRANADLTWLPHNRLVITNVVLWDAETGTQPGTIVVDVTGKVVEEMRHDVSPAVREPVAGGAAARVGTSPPVCLPLPPTLPKIATLIQREGRN